MSQAIVLCGLTKTFGTTVAVRDLDLTVPTGALYGVIGPNGAGKTTTIRMMLSILMPDRGSLYVLGRASALDAKDRIGYLPEERGLYKKMRVGAFLAYMAQLKGDNGLDLPRRIKGWLERVGLGDVERKRCEELSKGMQQKVQFLAAVIHRPDLIILDEPFSGLDPVNQRLIRELVRDEHRRGATVLFSTHVMVHAEQLCDHVVMIHRGAKVLDDGIANIRARFDPRSLLFEPLDPGADVNVLAALPGVAALRRDGAGWELALAREADPGAVIRAVASTLTPSRLEVRRPTLEDVFVSIVTADGGDAETTALRAAVRDASHAEGEVRT
ncbi:MAG: ATP-binding cassette domain-containing protein [Acidobacteriota bacterium]